MRLSVLLTVLFCVGCPHKMPTISIKPDLLDSLHPHNQLTGPFNLRGTGLKRLLGNIDLDIIAKNPHYIYLSIDSFFNQPARIVTYDGQNLYGIEEDKLEEMLSLPIEPEELVEILLRNYSPYPQEIEKIETQKNQVLVKYHSGNALTLDIDTKTNEIKKRTLINPLGKLIYTVTYEDFPKYFHLEANYKNKNHAMTLSGEDVKLNQGVFDEQLFRR